MRESIWAPESVAGRRQYIAYILVKNRDGLHMRDIARHLNILCDERHDDMPDTTYAFHNSRYRRIITSDIDAINRDMSYHMVISSDSFGAKIATKSEAEAEYDKLRHKALKTLAKAAKIAKKAELDKQMDITEKEIIIFMEGENE